MRSPPADIFVWGVHRDTTLDDIVNDLAESGINIDQKDIQRKSKDDSAVHSYRISVPAADLEKALMPEIWPLRVKVREYIYYPRKKVQTAGEQDKTSSSDQKKERSNVQKQPQPNLIDSAINTPVNEAVLETSNMFEVLANDAATPSTEVLGVKKL